MGPQISGGNKIKKGQAFRLSLIVQCIDYAWMNYRASKHDALVPKGLFN